MGAGEGRIQGLGVYRWWSQLDVGQTRVGSGASR